jgi:AcrR family transcriptional regulator
MSILSDKNIRRVLEAALILFARHGFKRTSMADIAREAGMARATLYLHFKDKGLVFKALAAQLVDDALDRAGQAWIDQAPLHQNLEATILAKDLAFFTIMRATPHGAELLSLDTELVTTEAKRLDDGFIALLVQRAEVLEQAGADLGPVGGAHEFAAFLSVTAAGIKYETRTEDAYRAAIGRLARVTAAAIQ